MHFHAAVLALGVHGVSRVSPALSRPSRLLLHKCTSLWLYRAWHSFFCFLVLIGIFFSSAEPAAVELGSEHPSPAQFSRSLTSGSVEVPSGAVGTQAEGTYAAGPSLAQAPPTSVEHVSAQGSGPDLRMGDTQNRGYGSALGRSQYRRDGMFVSDEVIEEHSVTRKHVVPTVRKPLPEWIQDEQETTASKVLRGIGYGWIAFMVYAILRHKWTERRPAYEDYYD